MTARKQSKPRGPAVAVVRRARTTRRGSQLGLVLAGCALCLLPVGSALASSQDAWPRPPDERLREPQDVWAAQRDYPWRDPDYPLGVGRFGQEPEFLYDWFMDLVMPLYESPDGPLAGWLAGGWYLGLDPTDDAPVTLEGMVETGYEVPSFVVLEMVEDGWFRLRFAGSRASRGGTGWALTGRWSSSSELVVESWASVLIEQRRVFFRKKLPHALRQAPEIDAERITWLDDERYDIEPIGIQGDWMFVRASTPSTWCGLVAGAAGRFVEGWIRWRSPEKGPWLYYATRGC